MKNFIEELKNNEKFKNFVKPFDKKSLIRDATFFIRFDGLLIFSEGYFHPQDILIGNIVYAPNEKGHKTIFGKKYESIIKKYTDDGEEWIPYQQQLKRSFELAPELPRIRPDFAEFKMLFIKDTIYGYFPHRLCMKKTMELSEHVTHVIHKVSDDLEIPVENIGCTGSLAFGNVDNVHDFDLVFYGSTKQVNEILGRINKITEDPERQVVEFGMKWAIRYFDDEGNMICPFFSYIDEREIPLKDFDMKILAREINLKGTICDDTHTCFMPTVLYLEGVDIKPVLDVDIKDEFMLLIYNGGLRGEYRVGDKIEIPKARIIEINIKDKNKILPGVLVTDLTEIHKAN